MKRIFLLPLLFATFAAKAQVPALVYDIQSGPAGSDPVLLTPFNNKLYFGANDGTNGRELWSYDGTNPPTMVYNINPAAATAIPLAYNQQMGMLNGKLYFPASNGTTGEELYFYDGVNPPALAADIETGAGSSAPRNFLTIGNKMYFRATSTASGTELYSYDGTNPPVKFEINSGVSSSFPSYLTEYNGKLYFTGNTAATGTEVFVYDPATNAYNVVQDIVAGNGGSSPGGLSVGGGKLWFVAQTAAFGAEVYSYDGTMVTRVTDVAAGALTGASSSGTFWYNNSVYFSGSNDGITTQLYKYDPATGNSSLVYAINPGGSGSPNNFIEYKGKLYFQGNTAAAGQELWVTDGTTTTMAADINPGATGSSVADFEVWNNHLFMNAANGTTGFELFRLNDPTGIVSPSFKGSIKVFPNPAGDNAGMEITLSEPQTIRVQITDATGREMWSHSQYTSAGTTRLDIPLQAWAAGNYFYGLSDENGKRLAAGTLQKN